AYARGAWSAARDAFLEADRQTPLDLNDLDRCAIAAYLVGGEEQSIDLLAREFRLSQDRDDNRAAARAASWAAFRLLTARQPGQGQALLSLGKTADGVALLDEVMVAITAGDVSPLIAGLAYCAVISSCQDTFDLRRAMQWTVALARWCDAQPDSCPTGGSAWC